MCQVQDPRVTRPEEFDFNTPVDLTLAPDIQRIVEALGHVAAYAEQFDRDWYSPGDEVALWNEAEKVIAEELREDTPL